MFLTFAGLQVLLFVKDAKQGNEINMLANLISVRETLQNMHLQTS
jgi:hypothetical protein